MENNVFIHPIGEDEQPIPSSTTTYASSSEDEEPYTYHINTNEIGNAESTISEILNGNITTIGDPFQRLQWMPFDWNTARQHYTQIYDLSNTDTFIIKWHDIEIRIPITESTMLDLKDFLKTITYVEE